MDSSQSAVAVGIHLAAGTGWVAIADAEEKLIADEVDRVALQDDELDAPRALYEFEETVRSLIDRLSPVCVGLLGAGTTRTPSAKASRKRGWLEAAVMLAAYRGSSHLVRVTHHDVLREFGYRPTRAELRQALSDHVWGQQPPMWNHRAPALAAAIAARREQGGRA